MRLTDNYTLVLRADYSNPAGFWWAIPEVMVPGSSRWAYDCSLRFACSSFQAA
jgi:hypothetical protein